MVKNKEKKIKKKEIDGGNKKKGGWGQRKGIYKEETRKIEEREFGREWGSRNLENFKAMKQ